MGATQHGTVRAPAVPQELDDGECDCEANSRNYSDTATPTKQTIASQNSHC